MNVERLRLSLDYNPTTGKFRRKYPARMGKVGADNNGYTRISIGNKRYYARRLAWLFMTGEWPSLDIDHINHNKTDNRFANLRLATRSQNLINRSQVSRGIHFFKRTGRWQSYIKSGVGLRIHLGTFGNKNDAAICYNYHAAHLQGVFAGFNKIDEYDHD